MAVSILSNCDEYNHYNFLTKYSKMADRIIIVSPFLAADISQMLSDMPTIKCVELYTNLDGYGMAINVLPAIRELYEYCKDKEISVSVKYNNRLHGKVYLLYKGNEGKGCIITSGNFTNNGLKSNHEYGVFIDNESMQGEIREQIYSLNCSELSYEEILDLNVKANEFTKKNSIVKIPVFKASDYIRNRVIMPDNCRFFLKPLGNRNRPVGEGYTIIEDNDIGFSKEPSSISKGDILICHGVKVGNVLGCCKVLEDEVKKGTAFDGDRWNWKLTTSCISEKYSKHWWDYDIKTSDLVDEYNRIKGTEEHITVVGGDTVNALKFGHQYIEITRAFAQFIMDSISKL
ncbi:MAG: NgoFVII family restriction endonuclease [Lachnospiraceae bacterium]|nr:NgoFVII family restriction endonuclease [Lachnospiraceae bacterium]